MVRRLTALLALCFTLISTPALAADFSATVDRKQVAEGDTFTLSLRYGEQVAFGSPDLKPLAQDFQVLNQQRSNQFRSINGKTESFTEWTLTLTPKRTGQITVPAISFDGASTQPIVLEVSKLSADVKAQQEKQFFFDISISQQQNYYVQGQILYTEKLYYSVNHDDATLSEFKVTDARVQPLGDVKQYTSVIDGVRFGVYERRYAIFPEVSGELVIPGQRFNATVNNPYDRWSRGRQASAVSKPITLTIQPIPASYPQASWLPASNLTTEETFSTDPSQWRAGEPVTRTLKLTATGLPGSQLPALTLPVIDKVRYYPDQTNQNEDVSDSGVTGTSEQSIAIVPTSSGRIVLPEIRIPWWNTTLGKLEYAILPAHTIVVAAANSAVQPGGNGTVPATESSDGSSDSTGVAAPATQSAATNPVWMMVAIASLLVNLVLIVLVIAAAKRRQPVAAKASVSDATSPADAWKAVNTACQQGDAPSARRAIIEWANRTHLTPSAVVSLSQLMNAIDDAPLRHALAELDMTLYSASGNSAWNGQKLLALLKKAKPQSAVNAQPGLYPA
ncbi:BatD family protein [Thalassolituus sp. LLYu03]|uniref:BatD family protein n=1 Tax=Thalassolituus sp. LLYu03 TaxID=3421656 RepID=UPI003D2A87EE